MPAPGCVGVVSWDGGILSAGRAAGAIRSANAVTVAKAEKRNTFENGDPRTRTPTGARRIIARRVGRWTASCADRVAVYALRRVRSSTAMRLIPPGRQLGRHA
jgi:hypothetical protein